MEHVKGGRPMRPAPQRQRILEHIAAHPKMTSTQIAAELGMSIGTVNEAIRTLRKFGAIRIGGWFRNYGTRGRMAAKWVVADGKRDAVQPKNDRLADSRRYYQRNRTVVRVRESARRGNQLNPWKLLLGMR